MVSGLQILINIRVIRELFVVVKEESGAITLLGLLSVI